MPHPKGPHRRGVLKSLAAGALSAPFMLERAIADVGNRAIDELIGYGAHPSDGGLGAQAPESVDPASLDSLVEKAGMPVMGADEPEDTYISRLWDRIKEKHPDLSPREASMKVIDYLGVGLFARGVKQLAREQSVGGGSLRPSDYAGIVSTISLKAMVSTPEERAHLFHEELVVNPAMIGAIAGISTLGESANVRLEHALHKMGKEQLTYDQQLFMALTIPWFTGPIISTVGSSGVTHDLAHVVAYQLPNGSGQSEKTRMDNLAAMIAYTSNWQFAGIGDPPALEYVNRFGLKSLAAIAPALFPLTIAGAGFTYNKIRDSIPQEAGTLPTAREAFLNKDNWELLARVASHSGLNVPKYLFPSADQEGQGVTIDPIAKAKEKLAGLRNWASGLPNPHELGDEVSHNDIVKIVSSAAFREQLPDAEQRDLFARATEILGNLDRAHGNPAELDDVAQEIGTYFTDGLRKAFQHGTYHLESVDHSPHGIAKRFREMKAYARNFFSQESLKGHAGHSFGDILLVVPWQLGAVPHAEAVLKDIAAVIRPEGNGDPTYLDELPSDFALYTANLILSGFMDNLAGFKSFGKSYDVITSYIGSMTGGGLTNIGNPAAAFNLATLEEYPVGESLRLRRMASHWPMAATSFLYAQGLKLGGLSDSLYKVEQARNMNRPGAH